MSRPLLFTASLKKGKGGGKSEDSIAEEEGARAEAGRDG